MTKKTKSWCFTIAWVFGVLLIAGSAVPASVRAQPGAPAITETLGQPPDDPDVTSDDSAKLKVCRPPAPQHYDDHQQHYKVLFVSGFAGLLKFLNPLDPATQDHWNYLRDYLKTAASPQGITLTNADILYYSYTGRYECDANGVKDFHRPTYIGLNTDLVIRGTYEERATYLDEIVTAFPDDRFLIVSHSLGGVVSLYWAATRSAAQASLVGQVESITTIDSPLKNWPGGCQSFIRLPLVPGDVLAALPTALAKSRVLTIRSDLDTVVLPDFATLTNPDPWRDLTGSLGDYAGNVFCDVTGHGAALIYPEVAADIASAMLPGRILTPTSGSLADAGTRSAPSPIVVIVTWPRDKTVSERLKNGDVGAARVTVGGSPATVEAVHDLTPSYGFSDVFRRRFVLRIAPSPSLSPGPKDLTVTMGGDVDTHKAAIRLGADTPGSRPGQATTHVVLTFDVSGSMADRDASGDTKIAAARDAGQRLLRLLKNDNRRAPARFEAGLVTFDSVARLRSPLTSTLDGLNQYIAKLDAGSSTNMADGLSLAADQLAAGKSPDIRDVLILLSDGVPDSVDEVRRSAVPKLKKSADCVYVVGLGDPGSQGGFLGGLFGVGSIDEAFLKEIAGTTTCGGYFNAKAADQLAAALLRFGHLAAGGQLIVDQPARVIHQNEWTAPDVIGVAPGVGQLSVSLNWPGSRLDLRLTDPAGQQVAAGYPGAELFLDQPPAEIIVANPMPGNWSAQAYGADVPEGSLDYSLFASTEGAAAMPTPAPAPVVAVGGGGVWMPQSAGLPPPAAWLILCGIGLVFAGLALVISRQGRSALQPPPGMKRSTPYGRLVFVDTPNSRAALVDRGPFTLGRDSQCHLVLTDPSVSRRHAQIYVDGFGTWLVDQGSTAGTYVNGARITRHALKPGDKIQLGKVKLRFDAA